MSMDIPVSQSLIAQRLGISRQVVSAILGRRRGTIRYARSTEQAVLAMAEEVGYRMSSRDALAGIHIIVSKSLNMLADNLLNMLLVSCRSEGLHVSIEVVPIGQRSRLTRDSVDGCSILAFPAGNDRWLSDLAGKKWCPILIVNYPFTSGPRIDFDEAGGMRQLLQWLHRSGRGTPAYMHPGRSCYAELRVAEYQRYCRETGSEGKLCHEHAVANIADSMAGFLHLHPEIDAVIIDHPIMMGRLMDALRICGRTVPGQVLPCSFNYSPYLNSVCPHTMCLDIRAADLARHLIGCSRSLIAGRLLGTSTWAYRLRSASE